MALSSLIDQFLIYFQVDKKASSKTMENYSRYLYRFLDFAGDIDHGRIDLEIIKRYELYLSHYQNSQDHKGLKKVTQNYNLIALRAFLDYLSSRQLIKLNSSNVHLTTHHRPELKPLSDDEVNKILHAPDLTSPTGLRDKAVLELIFATGLKVSEVVGLNKSNLDFLRQIVIAGKQDKRRSVAVSEGTMKWLRDYMTSRTDGMQPLFVRLKGRQISENGGEKMRLTARTIERIVEKYARKGGLKKEVTPFLLRHSFAVSQLKNGEDIQSINKTLGHEHLSTTKSYEKIIKNLSENES